MKSVDDEVADLIAAGTYFWRDDPVKALGMARMGAMQGPYRTEERKRALAARLDQIAERTSNSN